MIALWLITLAIILLAVGISGGVHLFVRKRVSLEILERHREVAGFLLAAMAAVYGALLAFVVVAVWEQLNDAKSIVEREATVVVSLHHNFDAFPELTRVPLQRLLKEYAESVIKDEWPTLANGTRSTRTRDKLDLVETALRGYEPVTQSQIAFYQECVKLLSDLSDARQQRILAGANSLPPVLWVVLLFGAVSTISFAYFFGTDNGRAQLAMSSLICASILLILFLVFELDNPFGGANSLTPEAMQYALEFTLD